MTTPATPATPAPKESLGTKVKTFFEHIGEFLKDHLGSAASFEQTAATTLTVVSPLLDSIVAEAAGEPFEAKVAAVIAKVQTSLNNAAAILKGAQVGDATHSLAGFLSEVQTDLPTLLEDAQIKNSAKLAKIEGFANTVLGEVGAIAAAIPEGHTVPVVGAAPVAAA
jgi:hypothetical protein